MLCIGKATAAETPSYFVFGELAGTYEFCYLRDLMHGRRLVEFARREIAQECINARQKRMKDKTFTPDVVVCEVTFDPPTGTIKIMPVN